MSLSATLDVARSSLSTTADRTAVVSRNVANSGDPSATRRIVRLVTDVGGAPRIASIERTADDALRAGVIAATSDAARDAVVMSALDKLDSTAGDPASGLSPAAMIGKLKAALQTAAARPADLTTAASVLAVAQDTAATLRSSARATADVRLQADRELRAGIADLNDSLRQLEELNATIVNGTRAGADVTDELDTRDALVGRIAGQIGIIVLPRSDNGVALFTDSGITLFDGIAREVTMAPPPLLAGQPGPPLLVDSVVASGNGSVMPITGGRIAGLLAVRDEVSLTYAAQLDEIARGLIDAFAETDQSVAPSLPNLAGLFRTAGSPVVPTASMWGPGLALSLEVNPSVDPARGGDISRLRDGGIGDPGNPAYLYNATAATGFTGRLQQLVDALSTPRAFDTTTQLSTSASATDFAAASVGWLHGMRQSASVDAGASDALLQRSKQALEKVAGINIDDEMTALLELERTYQASSKLISTVDQMFGALLQAVA